MPIGLEKWVQIEISQWQTFVKQTVKQTNNRDVFNSSTDAVNSEWPFGTLIPVG